MVKVPEHVAKIADKYIGRDGGPPTPPRPSYLWVGLDEGAGDCEATDTDLWAKAEKAYGFAAAKSYMSVLAALGRQPMLILQDDVKLKHDVYEYSFKLGQLQSFIPVKTPAEPAEHNPRAPRIALDMNRQPRSPRAAHRKARA